MQCEHIRTDQEIQRRILDVVKAQFLMVLSVTCVVLDGGGAWERSNEVPARGTVRATGTSLTVPVSKAVDLSSLILLRAAPSWGSILVCSLEVGVSRSRRQVVGVGLNRSRGPELGVSRSKRPPSKDRCQHVMLEEVELLCHGLPPPSQQVVQDWASGLLPLKAPRLRRA